ncbi:hypothetical protein CMV05_20315 [Vibrio anguillarum]|nr:hypothetical protein CEG15_17590 [Vibrio anguillarum]ASG05602.1 hypothetical protein CEJ46_17650 [Vibrio anguillarum]ASG09389.1 hypothetical protein CEQ50_18115 [Vibrio anguillarum]ATC59735.1 hypothetical protein CMV05_20315 [Vibrio anguillarum]
MFNILVFKSLHQNNKPIKELKMKRTTLALAASMIIAPVFAFAGNHNQNSSAINYNGPIELTSVESLLKDTNMFTEKHVVVEGKLIRQIRKDTFVFSDGNGEIQVELDDDIHFTAPLNAETKVRLYGEYEGGLTPEIEVDQIQVL